MLRHFIVWQWKSDNGQFIPYLPSISNFLEKYHGTVGSVNLGDADKSFSAYEVVYQNFEQRRTDTGFCREVKRTEVESNELFRNNCIWEWSCFSSYMLYPLSAMLEIEKAFQQKDSAVLLNTLPYKIDFANNLQINVYTGNTRCIQRTPLKVPYLSKGTTDLNSNVPTTSRAKKVNSKLGQTSNNLSSSSTTSKAKASIKKSPRTKIGRRARSSPQLVDDQSQSSDENSSIDINTHDETDSSSDQPSSESEIFPDASDCNAVIDFYCNIVTEKSNASNEDCAICLCDIEDTDIEKNNVRSLKICNHVFHYGCILELYKNSNRSGCFQCPKCKCTYGILVGNQPPGTMSTRIIPDKCSGYVCNTIEITYDISSGIQDSTHPNPGTAYTAVGFPRIAYIPNNDEGNDILRMLHIAWKRKLIFTIGRSSTLATDNCVVWNDIHHKTALSAEFGRGHGYPDPLYFDNVKAELYRVNIQ